jgi:hypothetical protein
MSPTLTFTEEGHEYRLGNERLLSVTQILESVGCINDSEWFTEEGRMRGRFVHKAIALAERGELDESTLDDRLAGYIAAYRRFVGEAEPGPCLLLETPLYDELLRYAGTPDQVRPLFGEDTVIDYKTGGPAPWHALQTAAYLRLVRYPHGEPVARCTLYLRQDGTYRLARHRRGRDWTVFKAALTVAHWKVAA